MMMTAMLPISEPPIMKWRWQQWCLHQNLLSWNHDANKAAFIRPSTQEIMIPSMLSSWKPPLGKWWWQQCCLHQNILSWNDDDSNGGFIRTSSHDMMMLAKLSSSGLPYRKLWYQKCCPHQSLQFGNNDARNVVFTWETQLRTMLPQSDTPPPPHTPEMMLLAKFSLSCIPLVNDDTRNVVRISPSIQETMMTAVYCLHQVF